MRHLSAIGRWLYVGLLGTCVVVGGIAAGIRLGFTHGVTSGVSVATGVDHQPWYGLQLAHAHPVFHDANPEPALPPPPLNAAAGILVDIDTGDILWSRNPHEALPPASTTKIMTALVILTNFSPDHVVTITPDALNQSGDETKMGLRAGEKLTVQELLSGMLLVSANDAATALATDTVGYARFVAAMNAQEQALGLSDSHFATPVGLDTPGHAISAYDEAAIASVLVNRSSVFRSIVASQHITLPASETHQAYDLWNINLLLNLYPPAVGLKPGYTGNAGYCLVGMAVRDGHRLISVLMNAPYDFRQSAQLLDWGFDVEGMAPLIAPPSATPSPAAHH